MESSKGFDQPGSACIAIDTTDVEEVIRDTGTDTFPGIESTRNRRGKMDKHVRGTRGSLDFGILVSPRILHRC